MNIQTPDGQLIYIIYYGYQSLYQEAVRLNNIKWRDLAIAVINAFYQDSYGLTKQYYWLDEEALKQDYKVFLEVLKDFQYTYGTEYLKQQINMVLIEIENAIASSRGGLFGDWYQLNFQRMQVTQFNNKHQTYISPTYYQQPTYIPSMNSTLGAAQIAQRMSRGAIR